MAFMHDIVLFGAPGCGKGTQGALLKAHRHISTGDLFRASLARQDEIGRQISGLLGTGQLIPDDITLRLIEGVCKGTPVAWDGFPRTVVQAQALENILVSEGRRIGYVINLVVPEEVLLERVIARFKKSKREDDNPEAFRVRLATYHQKTKPVLDFYSGRVLTLDGTKPIEVISDQIGRLL